MKAIWKFPIAVTDVQAVEMPKGARVLSVKMQAGVLCLWALVDPDAERVSVKVHVFGTGHCAERLPESAAFLGTVLTHKDALVWHIFVE